MLNFKEWDLPIHVPGQFARLLAWEREREPPFLRRNLLPTLFDPEANVQRQRVSSHFLIRVGTFPAGVELFRSLSIERGKQQNRGEDGFAPLYGVLRSNQKDRMSPLVFNRLR